MTKDRKDGPRGARETEPVEGPPNAADNPGATRSSVHDQVAVLPQRIARREHRSRMLDEEWLQQMGRGELVRLIFEIKAEAREWIAPSTVTLPDEELRTMLRSLCRDSGRWREEGAPA